MLYARQKFSLNPRKKSPEKLSLMILKCLTELVHGHVIVAEIFQIPKATLDVFSKGFYKGNKSSSARKFISRRFVLL